MSGENVVPWIGLKKRVDRAWLRPYGSRMNVQSESSPRRHDNPFVDPSTGHQYNIFWHDELSGPERNEAVRLFGGHAIRFDGLFVLLPPEDWTVGTECCS